MGYRLRVSLLLVALTGLAGAGPRAAAQEPITIKSAVVALADDPSLRAEFEESLVAKALEHDYDAITSYRLVPDIDDVDGRRFFDALAAEGARLVLMVRPAAVGSGASLDSVRNEVDPELLASMRKFARETSPSGSEEPIAVAHMAIYAISGRDSSLVSSGAVWLDEEVQTRAEGIERLQDLIVANVDAARPAIRRRLGLPALEPAN